MIDVAIFPIPGSVNFPGIPCPLHVFEPRYRKMVRFCLDNQALMGVCHTEKILHANEREQNIEEALNSNQATYKPCTIFSAGPVSLIEELPDGRMVIEVDTNIRLRLHSEVQTLPFSIWTCEEWPDQPVTAAEMQDLELGKQKILQRLLVLTHSNPQLQALLKDPQWQDMTASQFSFCVMGLIGLDSSVKQQLLEMTSPVQRLDSVLQLLNR